MNNSLLPKLEIIALRFEEIGKQLTDPEVISDTPRYIKLNKEYRDLVEKYNIGFNLDNNIVDEITEKIKMLINDELLRKTMGRNNRRLFEEKFDRSKTYSKIIKWLI